MRKDQLESSMDESIDVAGTVRDMQGLLNPKKPTESPATDSFDDRVSVETLDDGTTAWVIRNETQEERNKKFGQRYIRALSLVDEKDQLFDGIQSSSNAAVDPYTVLRKKKGMMDPDVLSLTKVKKAFSGIGLTANGAGPVNSQEAIDYRNAMEALRRGDVVLPTVSEFERQKRELEEEKKKMAQNKEWESAKPPVTAQAPTQETPTNATSTVAADAMPPKRNEATIAAQEGKTQKVQPINLAKMMDKTPAPVPKTNPEPPKTTEPPKPVQEVVEFNVPKEQASTFVATLPDDQKEKVKRADLININAIQNVDLPRTVHTIDNLNDYRRIVPKKVTGEYVEVVLPNSGYIATMSAASSLAMASIMGDPDDTENTFDLRKQYQFCFDYLVSTSIDDTLPSKSMSFNYFTTHTSPDDLSALIYGIYRASQPAKTSVSFHCLKCNRDYDVIADATGVVDQDAFNDDTKMQINRIIEARKVVGDAKMVFDDAPGSKIFTYKLSDDMYVSAKYMDGNMAIERAKIIQPLEERYGKIVLNLASVIKEIRILITPEGSTEPDWYSVPDPVTICQIISDLDDNKLKVLTKGIMDDIKSYGSYQFCFKGEFQCPHCGSVLHKVPVDLGQLIFFKASRAMTND